MKNKHIQATKSRLTHSGAIRRPQVNEREAPQYQETEADFAPGVGNDTEPMNGEPIPPEGLSEDDLEQ